MSKDDPRPSYVQVADNLRQAIDAGEYLPGQRLPSGRDLAKRFGVALNTAQHAVELLKTEGILESHPPRGVFVRAATGDPNSAPRRSPEYVEIMKHLDEIESSFDNAMSEIDLRLKALEDAVRRASQPRKRSS